MSTKDLLVRLTDRKSSSLHRSDLQN